MGAQRLPESQDLNEAKIVICVLFPIGCFRPEVWGIDGHIGGYGIASKFQLMAIIGALRAESWLIRAGGCCFHRMLPVIHCPTESYE